MSRIDFYFIPQQGPQARLLFACRLLEKAYQQGHQIYVHLEDLEKARFLDNLLWTFRDDSFIPHQICGDKTGPTSPIQIGHAKEPDTKADILLNLRTEVPAFHGRFKRVLEIMTAESSMQDLARQHRDYFEAKGYDLHSHQLTK